MYALIDCNNFYASCERVFRPDLIGKPVVILTNKDGCVIARSNEAKALGIPMGAPAFQYEKLFLDHNVHIFLANLPLYGDMSNRVMTLLDEYSPNIEIYSIDECFLNLQGFENFDLQEYGSSMCRTVQRGTGIPVSVGIAPTKSLSKVANRIAKKFPDRTGSVYIIDTEEKRIKALNWLKIEDVWGIGRKFSKKLQAAGVKTAYDFTQLDDSFVKKQMAIVGLRLKHDLMGTPTLNLEEIQPKKNIATTRTFEKNIAEFEQLSQRISNYAVSCAEKLRLQKSCCASLMVFVNTNWHRKDLPQYSRNMLVKLPYSTSSSIEITKFALEALEKIYIPGFAYKRAGIIVQDFSPEGSGQHSLFENRNERHIPLMKAVDKMNILFGKQKIRLASEDLKRGWRIKNEQLSPRYSTNLNEIITIHL